MYTHGIKLGLHIWPQCNRTSNKKLNQTERKCLKESRKNQLLYLLHVRHCLLALMMAALLTALHYKQESELILH